MSSTHTTGDLRLGARGARWSFVALLVGLAALAAALAFGWQAHDGFRRLEHAWLVACMLFAAISVGALFFVILQHLTRAGWSVVVRRVAESIAVNVVVTALLLAPLVVLVAMGDGALYPWADPKVLAADPVLLKKAAFLDGRFFAVRCAVYALAWWGMSRWLLRRSVEQDSSATAEPTLALERRAAPAMIVFGVTVSLAAFDLLMSLEPAWSSTIFGVYFFAGSVVAFFATAILMLRFLQARGFLRTEVTVEHYHDLGKFLFAFVFFWGYIAFSQFMLIWYADLPDETVWFHHRLNGTWKIVSAILLFGHFVVPFAGLLSRHAKRRLGVLTFWAAWMLAMCAVDLFWIVMPNAERDGALVNPMDLCALLAVAGLWTFALLKRAQSYSLVPHNDPRLAESLAFENL